ncbi:MAG: tagaturonate reductase [Eubacterium sp.]|nr:tagaturonate reductase [Eubacterium sp.]
MLKVLQIGEGNFLRAFAEDYIQKGTENGLFDAEVAICQPRTNTRVINLLKAQNCEYNVYHKGRLDGEIIDDAKRITCVKRCFDTVSEYDELVDYACLADVIISNTTEAGIAFDENDKLENSPAVTYPAKLCAMLYERFKRGGKELVLLPSELIENNADELKKCIIKYIDLWSLGDDFKAYVNSGISFCNTLVDRIVSGHIDGDSDPCSVSCEPYATWIIQADERCRRVFPIESLKGVVFTDDILPYRTMKVRLLNGTHTMSVLAAYMCGIDIVRDMMQDETFAAYIDKGCEEIKSAMDFDRAELDAYANSVLMRFNNPFIDHRLLDISLNSVSKFSARCLDSINDYVSKFGTAPDVLSFALAALIAFYLKTGSSREYEVKDSEENLSFFNGIANLTADEIVGKVLALYGIDISDIYNKVLLHYNSITTLGCDGAVKELINA